MSDMLSEEAALVALDLIQRRLPRGHRLKQALLTIVASQHTPYYLQVLKAISDVGDRLTNYLQSNLPKEYRDE